MTAPRVTTMGKEVLLDGMHLADCVSESAAKAIAEALEPAVISAERWQQQNKERENNGDAK